jgi:drug/metabolite transporter (DMT)-like permease
MTYWRSVSLVLLGACSYGVLSMIMKLGFTAGFTPGELSGSQLLFGGIMMSLLALLFSKQRFRFQYVISLAPVSLMMVFASLFYHLAVSQLSASLAIVLFFQFTWFGILLESISKRQWPSLDKWIAIVMIAGGTLLASGLGEMGWQDVSLFGLICGLLSGFAFAVVIFLSGRLVPDLNPYLRSAISISMAALILSLINPPTFLLNGRLWDGLLPYALLVALFGSVIPIFCLAVSVPRLGNGLVTILSAMELPAVVLLANFVLHEQVSLTKWSGVLLILAAIAVPQIKWRKLLSPSHSLREKSG